jgi:hypothetical protein
MEAGVMRHLFLLISIAVFYGLTSSCSLEGSDEFNCRGGGDDSLFETPPEDTVFVIIESPNANFNRTFYGLRNGEETLDPVEGDYLNLRLYEREPNTDEGRLYGLGTEIIDVADTASLIIAFNLSTGSQIEEVCRSTKVFMREHDWSKWASNILGVEIIMTIPIDGNWVIFSTDTSQEDDNNFELDGAEFLNNSAFYARLSGSFNTTLAEKNSTSPREAEVTGSFILNMRVSR